MQKESNPIDISRIPELLELAEEVQSSQLPRVLTRGREQIAVISPVAPRAQVEQKAKRTTGGTNPNDWLLRLAGVGVDSPPGDQASDVSSNKYKYLADAYANQHRPEE
jgi:hypothetical protein